MKSIYPIFGILILLGSSHLVAQESGFSFGGFKRFIQRANVEAKGPIADAVPIATSKSAEVLRLLYANDSKSAVQMSVTHLKSLVPSFLDRDPKVHSAYQQEMSFGPFLRVYGIADDVVAALTPSASATLDAWIEHAAIAEMLADVQTAQTGYKGILEQSPKNDAVRARLFFLSIEHAPLAEAEGVMRGLSPEALIPLGQSLMNQIQSIEQNEYDRRLNYVEMLAAYFEQVDPKEYVPAAWLLGLLDNYIGEANYGNTIRLGYLYQSGNYSVGYNNTEQEEQSRLVEERRRDVHERLCLAFLKLPQFAAIGFGRLSGLNTKEGENIEEFQKLAQTLLLELPVAPERPVGLAKPISMQKSQFREDWVPFLSPAEFLFLTAMQEEDYSALQKEVIPALESGGREDVALFLKDMIQLDSAEGDAFIDQAVAMVGNEYPGVELGNLIRRVVEINALQEDAQDLGPVILAYFKVMRNQTYQSPSFVFSYGMSQQQNGPAAYASFIDSAAVAMLGPAESHETLIKEHYQPNISAPETPGNAIQNYATFLGQMIQQSTGAAAIPLKKAFALKLDHPNDHRIRNAVQNGLQYSRFRNEPESLYQFLSDMGMLGELDTLEFYPMNNLSRGTLLGYVLYSLSRMNSDDKEQVLAQFMLHKGTPFAKAMVMSTMESSGSTSEQRDAITRAVEPFMDKILKLPEDKQEKFLFFYGQMLSNNSLNSAMAKEAPKVAAWYKKWRDAGGANRSRMAQQMGGQNVMTLEGFLKVTNRQDIDQQSGLDFAANQIMQGFSITATREELEPFIRHYIKLAEQPFQHQPDIKPVPNVGGLLTQWLGRSTSMDALGMAFHLMNVGRIDAGSMDPNMLQAIRMVLKVVDFEDPGKEAGLLTAGSQGNYDERLTPLFLERFSGLDEAARKKLHNWAKTQETPLAKGWNDVLAFLEKPTPETQAIWTARLSDREQPVAARLQEASLIGPVAAKAKAWPVVEQCMTTFVETWADEKAMVASGVASKFLVSLMNQEKGDKEARVLTKAFIDHWTPHLSRTPMGLRMVEEVMALDSSYDLDVSAWLGALPQVIQRQPGFLVMLMKHADPEQASAALSWSYVNMPPVQQQNNNSSRRQVRYINGQRTIHYTQDNNNNGGQPNLGPERMDRVLWDKMQAFLPAVKDPGARYFVEMQVSALPDGASMEGVGARDARLKELAQRYDRKAFASPYLAEHSVSWLCALTSLTENTREAVAHFGDQVDLRMLSEWGDGSLKNSRQGLLNHYVQDAANNNPTKFAEVLGMMLEKTDPNNGETQQLLEMYCQGFPQNVLKEVVTLDEAKARDYLPLLKKLVGMSQNVYWSGRDSCISGNFAMHVLANDAEGYREWLAELDINVRRNTYSETGLDQVVYLLRDGLNSDAMPAERRSQILNNLFLASAPIDGDEAYSNSNDSQVYERLIELNILKKDQILEQGLAWANLNSRSGAAYAELAKYQVEAGNNEDAVINYLQAAVHAPVRNRTAYTQYYLDEAELLLSLDRVDAAMTWLDFFDRGRLDTNKKDEFEQVSRETRARFLADPERLQATLAEVRSGIAQDLRNYQSWRRLAEVTSAMAQQCIAASDYPKGLAFSKLSFYILNRLKPLDPKFDPSMFQAAKQDLSKGLLALGLGGQKRSLISKRSEWDFHYYHGGLKTSGWYELNFMTDVSWKKGQAPFGYGDGDEATVLDFGKDKDNKPITGYFRKVFTVENPGDYNDLSLGVLHDDGMMVYLNGIQIARNNMPRTSIKPTSLAPTSRGSDVENKFWASKFKAQLLRKGLNVIAVEVHQNSEDSSDMGFDLEIAADALNTEEVIAEVESGSAMKPLKDWVDQLPPNWVGLLKGL